MSNIFKGLSIILNIFVLLKSLENIRKEFLFISYKWKNKYSIILLALSILFFIIAKILEGNIC